MAATAIFPVKRFTIAKERLGQASGKRAKRKLVRAMLGDALDSVGRSPEVDRVLVVTQEGDIPATETDWERIADDETGSSHSGAAQIGIREAIEAGAQTVVLLPGDCPLLDAAELTAALRRSRPGRVGIVPDRHGTGTNALVLSPPGAIEPAFGPGSRERHRLLAEEAGMQPAIERLFSLALDIDTPADLVALRQTLERDPRSAPRTAAVLKAMGGR